jgi:two-component system phosphate regulon sensor histidine kinase PhoR
LPTRTLVFRRAADGGVVGIVVEQELLDGAAARAGAKASGLPRQARARIRRLGEQVEGDTERQLATASFGPLLPHLTLSLVVDRRLPDPLDEIVERRGRRHVLLTGGLMILLMIGLVATIRGAARERELARLKSEFVSTVSHELKTPLTSIRMFAEMLQQGVAGSDRDREARYHEIIVKESERLGLLIANLLDYSQIERGTRRYARGSESLPELAREAVETFRRLREGEHQDVSLAVEPQAEPIRIWADREVIVQSILNLLSNAAKYGGGQPIAIAVRARPEGGVVAVSDQGPGIPSAEHERIFREFYRAPSAYKTQVEGTGLGLALVKRHVEAHGGAVELDSVEGAGATFSIVLPRQPEATPT